MGISERAQVRSSNLRQLRVHIEGLSDTQGHRRARPLGAVRGPSMTVPVTTPEAVRIGPQELFITIPSGGDTRARALPSFYWEGQGRAPDGPHRSLAIPVGVANTLPVTGSALGLGSSLDSALHDTTSITDSFTSHHKSSGSSTVSLSVCTCTNCVLVYTLKVMYMYSFRRYSHVHVHIILTD